MIEQLVKRGFDVVRSGRTVSLSYSAAAGIESLGSLEMVWLGGRHLAFYCSAGYGMTGDVSVGAGPGAGDIATACRTPSDYAGGFLNFSTGLSGQILGKLGASLGFSYGYNFPEAFRVLQKTAARDGDLPRLAQELSSFAACFGNSDRDSVFGTDLIGALVGNLTTLLKATGMPIKPAHADAEATCENSEETALIHRRIIEIALDSRRNRKNTADALPNAAELGVFVDLVFQNAPTARKYLRLMIAQMNDCNSVWGSASVGLSAVTAPVWLAPASSLTYYVLLSSLDVGLVGEKLSRGDVVGAFRSACSQVAGYCNADTLKILSDCANGYRPPAVERAFRSLQQLRLPAHR